MVNLAVEAMLAADWPAADWRMALRAASAAVAAALEGVFAGRDLEFAEALLLAQAEGSDLAALVLAADQLRRLAVGETVTYVVNRNLNFTNVCFVGCAFCGFSRGPGSRDAYFHSPATLVEKTAAAVARGATEVCIQGGLSRDMPGSFYTELLTAIHGRFPALHIHAFSPMEIAYGAEKTGLPLRDYLAGLRRNGLGSIPGTAAEILDDVVRRQLSPNKLTVARWIEVIRTAHGLGLPSTATMMYGHVETPRHWVRHMLLLRELQRETGGFTEFVPLGFIHERTRLYRQGGARAGAAWRDHLAVHALARVLLHRWIPNIQVSWVKLGFPASMACLRAGANDFSGTLMEESISKAAGANHGECVAPEEFRAMIRALGRTPAERTTLYRLRKVFHQPEGAERMPAPALPATVPLEREAGY